MQEDAALTKEEKTDQMPDEKQDKIRPNKEGPARSKKTGKENVEKELDLSATLEEVKGFLKSEIDREDLKKSNSKTILYLQEDQIISPEKNSLREILAANEFSALKKMIRDVVLEELDNREKSNKK
ncbi:MAG: hypothetical protein P8L82_08185 [Paracoccaceae bacterium]|nr:hypothetical protein [Paracoccaceae bacterium]